MSVKDAVAQRFRELCTERGIRPNELAVRAGVTPSTVYSLLDPRRRDVSVVTVKKLCDGLDITLGEFFGAPVFEPRRAAPPPKRWDAINAPIGADTIRPFYRGISVIVRAGNTRPYEMVQCTRCPSDGAPGSSRPTQSGIFHETGMAEK